MAAAEMRTAWHRTAATCYLLHEDAKRSSKPDDEAYKTKAQGGKYELSDGWSAVSSHYFLPDRKLDFHFHMENDGDRSPSKKSLGLEAEAGTKSLESDWQAIDSPSTCTTDAKVFDKDRSLAEKTSVSCSLSAKNLEVMGQRWRHANKSELAALIARKSSEDMGNCDLPPPLSPAAKGLLRPSAIKEDVFHGGGGEKLATPGLPSSAPSLPFRSLGALDPKLKSKIPTPVEISQEKPTAEEERNDAMFWKNMDSELLGEALCRSQTRAREAEKRAAEAVSERDQLLKLFFREASVSLTYKHWVRYLEAENSILRRQEEELGEQWPQDEDAAFDKMDQQHSSSLKRSSDPSKQHQEGMRSKKRSRQSDNSMVLGCTVGLAFALGVSLAGAGLVFGCTMGWILIAF
ncbi:uncharacterized protein LOC112348131 [Selaginella moellendorffii]|uniref:uncharacterized protein LOC112348131 n=1 Tax=Selaginella moellendorffii TaxID=88036 RepID=UPI000D1CA020|nr:uncharacterized protein LOC112348131 [Selaginella moellendorffii]XP_024535984.1 uncharacterized protein LOC112348131 [Selaginella moellendorffii]|eukprot:XP_024535983.1 uncharacterized protein LOC112348131 [Selaginella moellendorffii]